MDKYKMVKELLLKAIQNKPEARDEITDVFSLALIAGAPSALAFMEAEISDEQLVLIATNTSKKVNKEKPATSQFVEATDLKDFPPTTVSFKTLETNKSTLAAPTETQVQTAVKIEPVAGPVIDEQTSFDFPPVETPAPAAKHDETAPSTDFGDNEAKPPAAGEELFDLDEMFD